MRLLSTVIRTLNFRSIILLFVFQAYVKLQICFCVTQCHALDVQIEFIV